MQRVMSLVGKGTVDWKFSDGRSFSGYQLHFMRNMEDGSGDGQEVYCGNLSHKDVALVDGGLVIGQTYIVVTDKAQGKLVALINS